MSNPRQKSSIAKSIGRISRRAINLSKDSMVKTELLRSGKISPLVVEPAMDGVDLLSWTAANRELIETKLLEHGGILFRGFNIKEVAEFERLIRTVSGELLEYSYGSTPRSHVSGSIYTSTEYPANQTIPLHNEMSYSTKWPMRIWFFCMQPAEQDGQTPIAYSRQVLERISPAIKEQFIRKKIMYVRNYNEGLDVPWQKVFQTSNQSEVETSCREAGIDFEWKEGGGLRTRQVCQAVAQHPKNGEAIWFNQAHLFHSSNLGSEVLQTLLERFAEEELPRNVYFGDGSRIDAAILDEIRDAYQQEEIIFPWQRGDLLMLDNMLMAHGRKPYSGERKILVGMAEAFGKQEI